MPNERCSDNIDNINDYDWQGLYLIGDSTTLKKSLDDYNSIDPMTNMQIVRIQIPIFTETDPRCPLTLQTEIYLDGCISLSTAFDTIAIDNGFYYANLKEIENPSTHNLCIKVSNINN